MTAEPMKQVPLGIEDDLLANDEIDLRRYINALIAWWREILTLTIVVSIVAVGLVVVRRMAQRPVYEATAVVAIARTESTVSFDPKFKTDDTSQQLSDVRSRRSALLGLVSDGSIAQAVVKELGDTLDAREKDPSKLLDSISAVITSQPPTGSAADAKSDLSSDLVRIAARSSTPQKAAAIANAWALAYVQQVNSVYGQAPAELLSSVESALTKADSDYKSAQKSYEDFTANNRQGELTWQIGQRQALLASYQVAYTTTQRLAFEAEQQGQEALVKSYFGARNQARQTVFSDQVNRDLQSLTDYQSAARQTAALLINARSLREQVAAGGDSAAASSSLALQLMKTQAFALLPGATDAVTMPVALQIQASALPQANAAVMLADVDALIKALENRQQYLQTQIGSLQETVLSGNHFDALDKQVPNDSKLAQALQAEYPKLATTGSLAPELTTVSPGGSGSGSASTAGVTAGQPLVQAMTALQMEINSLKGQLEAEQARGRQLAQQRDLAWDTYKTLASKVAETNVAKSAANTEVRFAASALPPAEPLATSGGTRTVAMAAIVALIAGAVIALFADYMGQKPFFRRRQARGQA